MNLAYSRGVTLTDTRPAQHSVPNFATFIAALDGDRTPEKGGAYVCGPLNGDGRRCKEGALARRWIAVDLDRIDADAYAGVRSWFEQFSCCAWETHSSKRAAPRARVILELDREATRDECILIGDVLSQDLVERFGDRIEVDKSTFRPEQPTYLSPTDAKLENSSGQPLNVDRYLQRAKEGPKKAPERTQVDDRLKAAQRISEGHRNEALTRIGGKLRRTGLTENEIEAALLVANRDRGDPPLPDDEVRQIACSVGRYPAGQLDGAQDFGEPPHVLNLAELGRVQPPPPKFVVKGWLPAGEVTLFAGHGGSGKSAIALQLAVCVATGKPFFGIPTMRRRVFVLSLEDPEPVLHWRLHQICASMDVDLADLAEWLTVADGSQAPGELYVEGRDSGTLTPSYDWLAAQFEGHEVLIVDNASDAFGANEIVRRYVRAFVRAIRRLIPSTGAALLLAHVDKASARTPDTSQGFSGSTAWHNSARARWYLRPDGEGQLQLELQKANHALAGAKVDLQWQSSAHVFGGKVQMPASRTERDEVEAKERERLVEMIREAQGGDDPVPTAATGSRTTYIVMKERPGFPESLNTREGKRRFKQHIEKLRASKRIGTAEHKTKNRKFREVFHAA